MGNHVIQPSLTGGELAPALWGRVDLARYGNALKTVRNYIVQPYGGIKNRPGLRYVCEVKESSKKVRLLPFTFNASQTYALEMGDGYCRFISDGGPVVLSATPAAWVVGTYYNAGDHVLYGGVAYHCEISHTAAVFVPQLLLGYWHTLTASGSDWIAEIGTPYALADLPDLKTAQNADVLFIVHPDHAPRKLNRFAHDRWTLTEFPFANGPWATANYDKAKSVVTDGTTGTVKVTSNANIFSSTDVGRLIYLEQADFTQPWEVAKTVALGEIRRSDGKYYRALNAGTTGTLRPTHSEGTWNDGAVDWLYVHSGYGNAKITSYVDAKNVYAEVQQEIPVSISVGAFSSSSLTITAATKVSSYGAYKLELTSAAHGLTGPTYGLLTIVYVDGSGFSQTFAEIVPLTVKDVNTLVYWNTIPGFTTFTSGSFGLGASNGATSKWALGAWGGSQGYPSTVTFHQQRMIFGGTPAQPSTLWMSRTGDYTDFGLSQPIQDDDPITATLASPRMDPIRGLHAMGSLITLTAGAEYATGAGSSDVLTPSNTSFKVQGYRGSNGLDVIGVGGTALFCQEKGQIVRDLSYEFASDNYIGQDLTIPGSHLMDGHHLMEWAWHQTPHSCLWAIREDGALLGLTYMREQQVNGWHRHDTDGLFESVTVISEIDEDTAYFVVSRTINGQPKRYIEKLETRNVTDIRDAFFVDSGLTFDGRLDPATGAAWTQNLTLTGGTLWDDTETLTATMSAAVFSGASDIGDRLVFRENEIAYRLEIIGVTSSTVATVRPIRTVPAAYRGVAFSGWEIARDTISGLGHLEGKTVSVLADGNVQPQQTVVSGTIALNPPGAVVQVGLPITADLETLDLSVPGIETLLPKHKAIHAVTFYVQETSSLWAGRSFARLDEAKIRVEEFYDQPVNLQTFKVQIRMATDWGKSAHVCCRMTQPLPVCVLAIIPEIVDGGA